MFLPGEQMPVGFREKPSLHLQTPFRLLSWTGTHSSLVLQSWISRPTSQTDSWTLLEGATVVVAVVDVVVVLVVVVVAAVVEINLGVAGFWEMTVTLIRLGSTSVQSKMLLDVLTRTMEDLPFNFSILSGSGVDGKQDSSSVQFAWIEGTGWKSIWWKSTMFLLMAIGQCNGRRT